MVSTFEFYLTGEDASLNDGGDTEVADVIWHNQSFTIGNTGANLTFNISSIDLKLSAPATPAAALTIEVYNADPDGNPTGTAISTGSVAAANVGAAIVWHNIPMSSTTLKASTKYSIVFSSPTSTAGVGYNIRADTTAPSYGGGTGSTSSNSGTTWGALAQDAIFQVNGGDYTGTLCTLADAVNKAGVNASSSATNESLVSDFVKQAEGVINSVTRFDWVDKYSVITDDVKFILNQVASDLAATYIINYDLEPSDGSQLRVTSETMINVYRETIARGLSLLKNQEVKDFIIGDT